jgi:hypothetical protein
MAIVEATIISRDLSSHDQAGADLLPTLDRPEPAIAAAAGCHRATAIIAATISNRTRQPRSNLLSALPPETDLAAAACQRRSSRRPSSAATSAAANGRRHADHAPELDEPGRHPVEYLALSGNQ